MQPPLWHRTRTVDYVVVISGEIDLMLDDSVVHLKAGDSVVQQATNHAWVNRGNEVRRLLVLMDAKQPRLSEGSEPHKFEPGEQGEGE